MLNIVIRLGRRISIYSILLLTIITGLSNFNAFSQTVFFYEGFEGSNNGWVLGGAISGNNQNIWNNWNHSGYPILGTRSLYVASSVDAGINFNLSYSDSMLTDIIASRFINARGKINLTLEFRWKCVGEPNFDYGQVGFSTDSGKTFTWFITGGKNNSGFYHTQASAITQTYYLPDSLSNRTFTIGFRWINDISTNGGTPFTIDEMRVRSYPTSVPVADFTSDIIKVAKDGVITFKDMSIFKPIAWSWSFPGGTPATSNKQNPVIYYANPGVYNVTLTAFNSNGSNVKTKTGYIIVDSLVYYTGFETYEPDWFVNNQFGGNGSTYNNWVFCYDPTYALKGDNSLTINYTTDSGNTWFIGYTDVYTRSWVYKTIDARGSKNLTLEFLWKCVGQGTYSDYGNVGYSTDGGSNFTLLPGFNNSNDFYGNASSTKQLHFLPDVLDNTIFTIGFYWNNDEDINNGTPFTIDEIKVRGHKSAPVVDFIANTNRIPPMGKVSFSDNSHYKPTSWSWTFPGGTPDISNLQNPEVIYNIPGTYSVSLIATNSDGSNFLTKTAFVIVDSLLFETDFESPNNDWVMDSAFGSSYYNNNWYFNHFVNAWKNKIDPINAINGNRSLTINYSEDSGSTWKYGYADSASSEIFAYRKINASGYKNMTLEFNWKCMGEPGSDYGKVGISTTNKWNFSWLNEGGDMNSGEYSNHSNDTFQYLYLPDSLNSKVFYLGFYWMSDYSVNGGTPFTIDDLKINSHPFSPPLADFKAEGTKILQGSYVNLFDQSKFLPDKWNWSFPGASPNKSNEKNPVIKYDLPGKYDVTLIAGNDNGYDTIIKKDFITVDTCLGTVLRIVIKTDKWGEETSWELTGKYGLPIYMKVTPNTYIDDTIYIHDICVPADSELVFTIHDVYGDGICCDYGEGFYRIESYCYTYASGGDFATIDKRIIRTLPPLNKDDQFEKIYKSPANEKCFVSDVTCEGGSILTGFSDKNGTGKEDILLVKVNTKGDTLWTKTWGGKRTDKGLLIIQLPDGGFIVLSSLGIDRNTNVTYLIRTDYKGDTLWTKMFPSFYNSILPVSDGGFIISGCDYGSFNIQKLYNNGDPLWTKVYYDYNYYSTIRSQIYRTKDNNFLTNCYTYNYYNKLSNIRINKFDNDGVLISSTDYDISGFNYGGDFFKDNYKFIYSDNGRYLFAGYEYDSNNIYFGKIIQADPDGSVRWMKKLNMFSELTSAIQTFDGEFILLGNHSDTSFNKNIFLMKINNSGDSIWTRQQGADPKINYYPQDIHQLFDGGYFVTGYGKDKLIGWSDSTSHIFTLKTDSLGKGCFYEPYQNEQICLVTVEPQSEKNLVVWQRTDGMHTSYYNIWKETSHSGKYAKIGSVPFDSLSVFIDTISSPANKSERYKISVVNMCNKESRLSNFHKTMHLNINKGIAEEINLIWDAYEGFNFNTYKIFRGTSKNNMQFLDDIQNTLFSYSDLNPPSGDVFYSVSVLKEDTCYPAIIKNRAQTNSGPYSQSVSNLKDYSVIKTNILSVLPGSRYINGNSGSSAIFYVTTTLDSFNAIADDPWVDIMINKYAKTFEVIATSATISNRSTNITVTGNGVSNFIVTLYQGDYSGIQYSNTSEMVEVYPNPFSEKTSITYNLNRESNVSIQVFNALGLKVADLNIIKQFPGKYNYEFLPDQNAQSSGVYYLKFESEGKVVVKKLTRL